MTHSKSPKPTDQHVGARMRARRLMLGMTLEKLAEALGLTYQQVQKYEKGANRIGASRLQAIAQALQVPVSFFFEGAPDGGGEQRDAIPTYITDFVSTSDGLALAKAFQAIKRRELRRSIVALVEELAGSG